MSNPAKKTPPFYFITGITFTQWMGLWSRHLGLVSTGTVSILVLYK